jgi:hypothetical protein
MDQVIDKNGKQRIVKYPKLLKPVEIESSDYLSEEDANNEPENDPPL